MLEKERIDQIQERLSQIKKDLEERKDLKADEIDKMNSETEALIKERADLEASMRQKALNAFNSPKAISVFENSNENKDLEERANKLVSTRKMNISKKEIRSALLSSGKIAKPTAVDGIYNNTFGELGLLSEVIVKNYQGYETIAHAYKKANSTASDHTEGSSPTESEPTYGVIKVQPSAISLISYISKAISRTSPLDYAAEVQASALTALRLKAEDFIISKIPACTDTDSNKLASAVTLKETAINEKTLRNIVLNFKPGSEFKGVATLFLTREQLIAFGDVRGTNEKLAVYTITPDVTNTRGTIQDKGLIVNYRIVDNLTNMLYGYLGAFELDTFGDYSVEVSDDYKFAEGLLAVRGEAWIGGSLIVPNAFEVISFGQ